MTYPYRIVMVTMDGKDGNGYIIVWVFIVDHWKPISTGNRHRQHCQFVIIRYNVGIHSAERGRLTGMQNVMQREAHVDT